MPRIRAGAVVVDLEENFLGRVRVARDGAVELHAGVTRSARRSAAAGARPLVRRPAALAVFVSHSSADQAAAAAFVELLRAALPLSARAIRCTSVSGHKLPAGTQVDERLRREVFESQVLVALLSPRSIESTYVMFELGARWGAKRTLLPVLIGGLAARRLKAPLPALHVVKGRKESDVHQLVHDLAHALEVAAEKPDAYLKAVRTFVTAARARRR
jgi:hypothetical protein